MAKTTTNPTSKIENSSPDKDKPSSGFGASGSKTLFTKVLTLIREGLVIKK